MRPMRNRGEQSPSSAGIKKGDQVRVMTGRDRGKTGRVLAVNPLKRSVTVEHANMVKRHTRANPSKNVKGGIVEKEGSMSISNILLVGIKLRPVTYRNRPRNPISANDRRPGQRTHVVYSSHCPAQSRPDP